VNFDLGGLESITEVTDRSTFTSKNTGSQLEKVKVEIVVSGSDSNEKMLEIVTKGKKKGFYSIDKQGNAEKKWKIIDHSYRYQFTDPKSAANADYYHTMELEETEVLELESLEIGGLKLKPYVYAEKFEDKYLVIDHANVKVTGTAQTELNRMVEAKGYFPVARIGIDAKPREMRFGQVLWSEHEGETKFRLVLVEKGYDEYKGFSGHVLHEPMFSNMKSMVSMNSELIKELIAALKEKRILTAQEAAEIKSKSQKKIWDTYRMFTRVDDVDEGW
jgi:hypothetical protein